MRYICLIILFAFHGRGFSQTPEMIANGFVQSLVKNNFEILNSFMVRQEVIKRKFPDQIKPGNNEVEKQMNEYKLKLKADWNKYITEAKKQKIDLSKLKIIDFAHGVAYKDSPVDKIKILYKIGTDFRILELITLADGSKNYLFAIPTPINLIPHDSNDLAIQLLDLREDYNPEIKQKLESLVDSLLKYVRDENVEAFAEMTRGNDKKRYGYDVWNGKDPAELKSAKLALNSLKEALGDCNKTNFSGGVLIDRNKGGTAYLVALGCGTHSVNFVFEKFKNEFVFLYAYQQGE